MNPDQSHRQVFTGRDRGSPESHRRTIILRREVDRVDDKVVRMVAVTLDFTMNTATILTFAQAVEVVQANPDDCHLNTIRNVCIDESSVSNFSLPTVRRRLFPYLLTFSSSGTSLLPIVVPSAPKYDSSGWIPAWVTLHRCHTALSRQSYDKEPTWNEEGNRKKGAALYNS